MVNTALLHYFVKEIQLYDHLAVLNDFLLVQNGVFAQCVTTALVAEVSAESQASRKRKQETSPVVCVFFFVKIKKRAVTSMDDLGYLAGSLKEILKKSLVTAHLKQGVHPLTKHLSFELVRSNDILMKELIEIETGKLNTHIYSGRPKLAFQVGLVKMSIQSCILCILILGLVSYFTSTFHITEFQFLNALRLSYTVDWPLNIIITDDMIHHYETLSGIFMQLSRSEELLQNLFLLLKSKRKFVQQE